MMAIPCTRHLAALLCSLTVGVRALAQEVPPQPPSEPEVLDYLENMDFGGARRRILSDAEKAQLRLRIYGAPQASIPILRKLVTDGRAGPGLNRAAVKIAAILARKDVRND